MADKPDLTLPVTAADLVARVNEVENEASQSGTSGSLDVEAVQDAVAAMLTEGTGVTLDYDDGAGTLTITATAGGGSTDPEIVRDVIGSALVAGTGVTVTVDDAADTITLAVSGLGISDVSGLQAALDGKAAATHTHDDRYYTEGEVDSALSGKANTSHSHPVTDLTATGTPSATTYLRGDGAWETPAGGGGGAVPALMGPVSSAYYQLLTGGGPSEDSELESEFAVLVQLGGPQTWDALSIWFDSAAAGATLRLALRSYSPGGIGPVVHEVIFNASATGRANVTGLAWNIDGGVYLLTWVFQGMSGAAYRSLGQNPPTSVVTPLAHFSSGIIESGLRFAARINTGVTGTLPAGGAVSSYTTVVAPPALAVRRSA